VHIDKFTGLTDGTIPPAIADNYPVDSSNRGTRFWVAYGHHYSFGTNAQDMVLYLSTQEAANVQVKVNGTSYVRNYAIPANTARVSLVLPKSGLIDSRITDEGKFNRGISITSDKPIEAYTHIYDGATSGAGMLLPVGVYGYEYQSLNSRQYYPTGGAGSYSWFMVIADRDSTLVEITPVVETKGGRPANVPFQVYLNKGEVYNVMGTINGAQGTDLSGSLIKSVPNASGKCYPVAVFSGSSRTAICNTTNGDNLIQQVFPSQAWGTKYLTFATANSTSNTNYNSNLFRIMVKDVNTVVSKNGVALDPSTLILPGKYYEFSTTSGDGGNGAIYIEANQPVMMAQYMVSTGANCPGVTATGNGDPEMIYISPIEQGIKRAVFYNTNESAITSNYINAVVSTAGLASLTIDGVNTFTDVFAHPFLPGYSCIRHNLGAAPGQHTIQSDSAFTAITYGLGSVESYGYNAGTLVKNLNGIPSFTNTLGTGNSSYTCVNAPFKLSVQIPLKPTYILWRLGDVPQLNPSADTMQMNPVATDSVFVNNRWFYKFVLNIDYRFSAPGSYNIPITLSHPSLEGCSNTQETTLTIHVIPAPSASFTGDLAVCLGESIQFNGAGTTSNGVPISTYNWTFGDATTATGQNPLKTYAAAGTYNVNFSIIAQDGCIGDTTKEVVVNPIPLVTLVEDSIVVCGDSSVTFEIQSPEQGAIYNWYEAVTGGTPVFTGTSFTIPNVNGTVVYYVQPTSDAGCTGERKRVVATVLPDLLTPIAVADSIGVDRITFRWDAVQGAATYEVSTDGGGTWQTPSSGATGLTHTVTGLLPLTDVTLSVRALGIISCQEAISQPVTAKTLTGQLYIPNAFSPNGDGLNDLFLVYGYTIRSLRLVLFNQWGEKIFESNNQATGWNGTYKGKPQPSGVYMYVCQLVYRDGTTEIKKGSVNLVR
jgi:trimeric autotransporter adhesin